MSDMTTQNAIYCMKAMLCEEVCEDCDYYGKTGTDHCEADAIRMAIKALEEQPHWIPCSERMPKEKDAGILKMLGTEKKSEYVLATVEVNGKRMTVTARTYDGKWDWNMKYAFPDFKVVAWMPLPEPYGGESDD